MRSDDLLHVGDRGTITIPKRLRDELGLAKGARLQPRVIDGDLVLRPVRIETSDRASRARLIEASNEAYARLRADPQAWEEYRRELALWDVTLMDGLSDG
jgi:AbrB family looped-hinge helix DNA binding protein